VRSAERHAGEPLLLHENCLSVYVPYCGDGNLDVGEECDPPNATPVNTTTAMRTAVGVRADCGDGNLDVGEECDPP